MASVHISVKPEIWEWVAKQISDIQSSTGIYGKLNEWIEGSVLPTFKQIEKLSKEKEDIEKKYTKIAEEQNMQITQLTNSLCCLVNLFLY